VSEAPQTSTEQLRVLFLCTGNSARSQMAEGLVTHLADDKWIAYSAGTIATGTLHTLAVRAMSELGIDISAQRSKSVNEFRDTTFDLVVTVCDDAAENCPVWLGDGRVTHIGFPDPAAATGTKADQMEAFRTVRDGLRQRVLDYLAQVESSAGK
jgi:arsenate reductase